MKGYAGLSLLLALTVFASFAIKFSCSARVVVIYAICSKSHMFAVMPVVEELAKRGHEVTVFTPFEGMAENVVNGREIFLKKTAEAIERYDKELDWFAMQKEGPMQIFTMFAWMRETILKGSEDIFTHPEFLRIVNNRDVDLFLVDGFSSDFLFPVFDSIKVPFVTHCASTAWPAVLRAMGAPVDYASVPTSLTEYDDQMTLVQRIIHALSNELLLTFYTYNIVKPVEQIVQKHFPGVKQILEVYGDASICIINSHPTLSWPRSLPPTIVPIGALHTRPAKSLPPELQEFADGAKDGLVVFTLGSMVSGSSMPKTTVDTFIRVFSRLPQKVIWKWESDMQPLIPPNVKMVKWLPQQDLLGHPNTRVFISHGGMLGTQEAAYHGVPILGIPFGNDQRGNIALAKRWGWGHKLDWDNIDDKNLYDALVYLIHDPSVRAKAIQVSQLMHDEIMPGTDTAVYWIEYVLRHGGTKHLQLAAKNLPFYKLYFLDAFAVAISLTTVMLLVSLCVIRVVYRWYFVKKQKSN